jgi:hypothetical protein
MDFYLENDTEVDKVKENGFKVHYLGSVRNFVSV